MVEMQGDDGIWPLSESLSTENTTVTVSPGCVGLRNLGNTCCMNAALQCLIHTPDLTTYFVDGYFKGHINVKNPIGKQQRTFSLTSCNARHQG